MRRRQPPGADVRTAYAEKLRRRIGQCAPSSQMISHVYGPLLARVEAGGPTVLQRWRLGDLLPERSGDAHGWWVLEADGAAVPVVAVVDDGRLADYRRADGSLVFGKVPADA